jgi:hypothetical protein
MTVEVGDVTFNGDTAQAQVRFRSKQMPNVVVGVNYKLRRVDNRWQVESTSRAALPGTTPHGGAATATPSPSTSHNQVSLQPSH